MLIEFDEDWEVGHWHMLRALPDGSVLGAFHDPNVVFDKIQVFRDEGTETVLQLEKGELGSICLADEQLVYAVHLAGESSIWTAPFSLAEGRLLGEPRLLVQDADQPSVSRDGALAYLATESVGRMKRMAWLDLPEPDSELASAPEPFGEPRVALGNAILSPDGRRISFTSRVTMSTATIFVHEVGRGVSTPLVEQQGWGGDPVWLPGDRLAISRSTGQPRTDSYSLTGKGDPELLTEDVLLAISPDGRYFALEEPHLEEDDEMRIVGPGIDGDALPHVSPDDNFVAFSPDSEWMLYSSNRSGTRQLYLSSFPEGDRDVSVCVENVHEAWFQKDLEAIYYVTGPRWVGPQTLWRVELTYAPELKLGMPVSVYKTDDKTIFADYDGDRRFLVLIATTSPRSRAILDTGWAR